MNIVRIISYMRHKCHSRRAGEDSQLIVARHIKLLHRYNEAKDAAQVLHPYLMSVITNIVLSKR